MITILCDRSPRSSSHSKARRNWKALFASSRMVYAAILFVGVAMTGCGSSEKRLPTFKAKGKVVQNGAGLANVTVVLHPKVFLEGMIKPRGVTDANGEFSLTTYEAQDGAPEGEYEVSLQQWLTKDAEKGPQNMLPANLSTPSTSGLTLTIAKSENELKPIEIP